ncbi:MAG: hypothetical protein R3E90_07320 [Marinicella sp.]|nr:hypothetical protein [Xanthomonadales bacterium]
MKYRIFVVLLVFLASFKLQAQCSFNNFFHSSLTLVENQTATAQCVQGGQFVSIPVVTGETYALSTCNSSSGGDSQITAFNSTNTATSVAYDDDTCAVFSSVSYEATFTGNLYTQVNEYNCVSSTTCFTLDATCISCGSGPDVCSYALELFDSFGDGWNGASLAVSVNGSPFNNYTLTNGFSGNFVFSISPLEEVVFSFNNGTHDAEISYNIYKNPDLNNPIFAADYSAGPVPTGDVFSATCGEIPIFANGFEEIVP